VKISLKLDELRREDEESVNVRTFERLLSAVRQGDFQAREALLQEYMPLITRLARKRAGDAATSKVNSLIEAGRQGLFSAARHYRISKGPAHFKLYALECIEKYMDRSARPGFFQRLLGRC